MSVSKQHIDRPQSPRWAEWDYSRPAAYFVTVCTKDRACLFGNIVGEEMRLNEVGRIVEEEWLRSPEIRKEILLDAFVVMPNHFHGIVGIVGDTESHCRARLRGVEGSARSTLGSFMAGFKAYTTRRANQVWHTSGRTVWQPSFYDHVIRSERGYDSVQHYIATNVLRWAWDENHPERILKEQAKR